MDPDPGSSGLNPLQAVLTPDSSNIFLNEAGVSTYLLFAVSWILLFLVASTNKVLRSFNRAQYEQLKEQDDRKSQRISRYFKQKDSLRLSLYLVHSLLTVLGILTGIQLVGALSTQLTSIPALQAATVILLVSGLYLLATGVGPQLVESRFSLGFLGSVSPLLHLLRVAGLLTAPLAGWLRRTIRFGKPAPHLHSAENLKALADLGEAQGTIEEDERELIHSIFEFGDTTVREIMISRLDINSISLDTPLDEALKLIQNCGHSRLPLQDGHLDNILGIIYAKDLLPYLRALDADTIPDWRNLARPAMFVSEGKLLDDLLKSFKEQKTHLAIVVDKYGGTAGLATMEDVLEEIVGEILDEYDDHEEKWHTELEPNLHSVDARIDLDDLNDLLKIELDTEKFDFDTLGGLIFHLAGDIPSQGDMLDYGPLTMRIESVENHRIGRVRIEIAPPQEAETS